MKKKLKIAFLMDPLENLDLKGDSTFALALEAQNRGHTIFFLKPDDLILRSNKVFANICKIELSSINGIDKFKYYKNQVLPLSDYDIVMMRQDPPFDLSYITATHILEKLPKSTLVVNNPFEVRNAPEKIFVTNYPHLMPKTLITRDLQSIKGFREEFKDIIIKPLYGNGGQGVFHVLPSDENFNSILEMFFNQNKEPLIIQEYLKDVRNGDKRIILLDGEIVGAINRIPQQGESRSNMHVGGQAHKTILTKRDKFICKEISQSLKDKELLFVGIDIIGDFITEINVTSPTGIREIRSHDKIYIEKLFWDFIEQKLEN
ncbi:glutathione synthase [Alphaproteobacteria bacterium]|nr:glutathione synthase [Alphaproteobacteria bacterium]